MAERRLMQGEEKIAHLLLRNGYTRDPASYEWVMLNLSTTVGFGVPMRSVKMFIGRGVDMGVFERVIKGRGRAARGHVKLTAIGKRWIELQDRVRHANV